MSVNQRSQIASRSVQYLSREIASTAKQKATLVINAATGWNHSIFLEQIHLFNGRIISPDAYLIFFRGKRFSTLLHLSCALFFFIPRRASTTFSNAFVAVVAYPAILSA